MPIDDALSHLMKAPGRTGVVVLKSGNYIKIRQLSPLYKEDGSCAYEAIDSNGMRTVFTKEQVQDVQV